MAEDRKKKGKPSKKADVGSEPKENKGKDDPKKKNKKGKDVPEAEEPEESEIIVSPDGKRSEVGRSLPPPTKGSATIIAGSPKGKAPQASAVKSAPEKPAKKENFPINPSQVHVHDIQVPEDLKQYQRGCLLKIRKVGNSRFSQEMTRCANQLFIKKLGRGQYFVPDYYILSEIQAWAKKWETTLEYMPLDDEIRQAHMVDVKSKMSSTGEDLTKKVKDLTHALKLRDDQFIKVQMAAEEEKINLSAEIDNLHKQLDESEQKIDELQAKQDDSETGTGAAEISILRDRVKSLEEENGQLRGETDSLREQLTAAKKSPTAVAPIKLPAKAAKAVQPAEEVEPVPVVEPEKPVVKAKPAGKAKPAAKAKPIEKAKPAPKAKPAKGKKKIVEEEIPPEDAAELEGLGDLLEQPEEPEPEEDEPVDEKELAKAMAYKKPKWDDEDTSVEVQEDENVEMSDEELKEFEREQKKRESEDAGEDSDADPDEE
jgi:regulator of replication initiation timing